MKKKHLTIGVPIRNERRTLVSFFRSLAQSAAQLPDEVQVETIACFNGTTDGSDSFFASEILGKYCNSPLCLRSITSDEGKIVAQQAIMKVRGFTDSFLCFLDADILLDSQCISELWKVMNGSDQIEVAYACVQALNNEHDPSLIERVQKIHYQRPEGLSKRNYFHGRAYMLRRPWKIPRVPTTPAQSALLQDECFAFLELHKGPLVDDIYLSRHIAHNYGLRSIVEVPNATVLFIPPATLSDFYHGQKRLWMEVLRLDLLFPEHAYLQERHFERRMKVSDVLQFGFGNAVRYLICRSLEKSIRAFVQAQLRLALTGKVSMGELWKSLESTKTELE